ncbi:C-C motif chemokine 4-like isoform X2 [Numida meleagris]|uniref:C-C motif chemokine 4-like isoform X2 n=1 Tax=Numida meleagris TaxID=8996 RepID=UPI000B3DCEF3|nr:C-C motif chemokine 4-like isoform X2 [Numida meleagris]
MKGSVAALAALLLLALCSLAVDSSPVYGDPPTACCYSYVSRPIRYRLITAVYVLSSACPQPAVILVTKKGKQICADPKHFWVQALLELFQNRITAIPAAVKEVKMQR